MTNVSVILQIMFISIGMVALSQILSKYLGLNLETARELRDKALNLQERIKTAQVTSDLQEMLHLRQESSALMKQMMKKQLIPSCFRCVLFLGIFAIIGIFYAKYAFGLLDFDIPLFGSGWIAVYFLFSLIFSLLVFGTKYIYRKLTGKINQKSQLSREIMNVLSPTTQETRGGLQLNRPLPSKGPEDLEESKRIDSWKKRIKKKP